MTTPQESLYRIAYKVDSLLEMFDGEEDELGIFECVKEIYKNHQLLIEHMERLEDQMSLIIKLLNKD